MRLKGCLEVCQDLNFEGDANAVVYGAERERRGGGIGVPSQAPETMLPPILVQISHALQASCWARPTNKLLLALLPRVPNCVHRRLRMSGGWPNAVRGERGTILETETESDPAAFGECQDFFDFSLIISCDHSPSLSLSLSLFSMSLLPPAAFLGANKRPNLCDHVDTYRPPLLIDDDDDDDEK